MFAPQRSTAQDFTLFSTPLLIIDREKLFAETLYGSRITFELEAASKTLASENRRIEADLTAEEKDLTEQRKIMEPEEFRVLADAFDVKVQDIRRAQLAKARSLPRIVEQQQANFFTRIRPILIELMQERGAVAILDRRVVFAVVDGVDITGPAIARIDQVLGDGKTPAEN